MQGLIPLMRLFASAGKIEGRTKVQKMVYVLQSMGFPFKEHYLYHLHGPYARGLTDEISYLVYLGLLTETGQEVGGLKCFHYEATDGLRDFLSRMGDSMVVASNGVDFDTAVAELNAQKTALLEAAATAVFLNRAGTKRDDVASDLKRLKPHLGKHVDSGVEYLDRLYRRGWLVSD